MAEAVVSFLIEKLGNLVKDEAGFLFGVNDQVRPLETELRQMQAFLRVAESMAIKDDNISNYLKDVREAAYAIEDILDNYILLSRQGLNLKNEFRERRNIGTQIKEVRTKLKELSERKNRYGIPDLTSGAQGTVSQVDTVVQEQRALAIRREMNVTVGFEDMMKRIVGTLLNISENPRRCVVSIVGMGGAGKSTLAKRVCNKAEVMRSFDGVALVTVSQIVNLRKILEDIAVKFSNIDRTIIQQMEDGELKEKVWTSLQGKKYLIVLDDIWETNVCPLICPHFPDEKNGSRIIITTRSMYVAQLADPSMKPHQLRPLSDQESWELFTKIVFQDGHDDGDFGSEELTMVGKKILKSCGGLPLAIVLMGGMLSIQEKSPIVWEDAVKGMSWEEVPRGWELSEVVVGLSYRDLPHHLKPCFLYLSHFPEDYEFFADYVIRLWTAEGFVPDQMDGQHKTMEETAQGWLEDLVRRCLVQVTYRDYSGMLVTCQMHDVVRDLCMKEAEKVNFFHTWQQQQVASGSSPWAKTRRLALHGGSDLRNSRYSHQRNSRYTFQQFFDAPKLRSLAGFAVDIKEEQGMSGSLPSFIMGLKLLRVLNLKSSNCRELPKAIGDLTHLRYLGLTYCDKLESIPSSVGNLQNLQTFDVYHAHQLESVPDSVWGIGTLRHVLINVGRFPGISISSSLQPLVNLQTLTIAVAGGGSWMGSSLATLTTLKHLGIRGISEAHTCLLSDSLDTLPHLRYLSLKAERGAPGDLILPRKALALPHHHRLQKLVLEGRLKLWVDDDNSNNHPLAYGSDEMPPNLNELYLRNTRLPQDPFLLLEKLPYLRSLSLNQNAYEGTGGAVCCSAGGFPQLEVLAIVSWLRRWTVEGGALPRLRRLSISSCRQLEMLPDGLPHLETLQTLVILGMPEEFVRRLRKDEGGEDWHKIQHIPHLQIFP